MILLENHLRTITLSLILHFYLFIFTKKLLSTEKVVERYKTYFCPHFSASLFHIDSPRSFSTRKFGEKTIAFFKEKVYTVIRKY